MSNLWTTHVCQAPSTVTRELRSEAAGSELVERLIAAAGGIAGLVPSGTEPIPVKRSWNSEHGLQAERSICLNFQPFITLATSDGQSAA